MSTFQVKVIETLCRTRISGDWIRLRMTTTMTVFTISHWLLYPRKKIKKTKLRVRGGDQAMIIVVCW